MTVIDLHLRPVIAVGRRTVPCFGQGTAGPFYEITLDDYPPNPFADQLRELRVGLGLGVREACTRLDLSPTTYCELERGQFDCDWAVAQQLLRQDRI